MNIAIVGLTISSSWGNGHATTYRALVKALDRAGHSVTFYEQDVYWYACARDLAAPPYCKLVLYRDVHDLTSYRSDIANADLVIVGSFVPEGIAVGDWVLQKAKGVTAFYDIDTPVTLAGLESGRCTYLLPDQIRQYDLFLSLSDGPVLKTLQDRYGSPHAVLFSCSVDPELYFPDHAEKKWDLGYMGTYSDYRQNRLEELLMTAAKQWRYGRFVVAGSQYPDDISWSDNLDRIEHIAPAKHREFYNRQRFTLNLTRKEMVKAGYSPSVRLFEACACGVPVISDRWPGIENFLVPGEEILIADSHTDILRFLTQMPEEERLRIGKNGRSKILGAHTASHRARQLEVYVKEHPSIAAMDKLPSKFNET